MKQMQNSSVDLIIADPPYEISISGGGLGRKPIYKNKELKKITEGFNAEAVFEEFERICRPLNVFCFCSNRQISRIMGWAEGRGYGATLLVLYKPNAIPFCNNTWKSDAEFCVHIRGKKSLCKGDYRIKSKVFTHIVVKNAAHPTVKPLELIKKYILVGSQEGALVFDPFMGSGTTAVACKELGRNFIGCEIEQKYIDVANQRIKNAKIG